MMKRMISAAILSVVLIIMCISANLTSSTICKKLQSDLDNCTSNYLKGNTQIATEISKKYAENWDKKEHILTLFCNHSHLKKISESVEKIPFYIQTESTDLLLSEAAVVDMYLEKIRKEQEISAQSFY